MDSRIVLDLHGGRAQAGVEIDAFEVFLGHFRAALREFDRSRRGTLAKRGGRPDARDAVASAFRLVEFRIGSGIATLEPARTLDASATDLELEDAGDDLSVATLRALLKAVESDEALPKPVVDALGSARRAIGEDGSFGVEVTEGGQAARVTIDEARVRRLQRRLDDQDEQTLTVTGRLHMIEVDQPGRRVGVRGPDGVDWSCTYVDHLHPLVTTLIERLVRVEGSGRRLSATTGHLRIEHIDAVAEHAQDALFTFAPVSVEELRSEQGIDGPQGIAALIDEAWEDDEESRRFLEATLGPTKRP